jgi:beta-glucosidase
VLSGQVNPSGRLPVTFYASTRQLPAFAEYSMQGRTYRYFTGKPQYPFGHGLSYTRFDYSQLRVMTAAWRPGSTQEVSVTVRNAGAIAGAEVVQLYLSTPGVRASPLRSLRGFERVELAPGEARNVRFSLAARDLAFAGDDGRMRVSPAQYRIWVGGGQPGAGALGLAGQFQVSEPELLPP